MKKTIRAFEFLALAAVLFFTACAPKPMKVVLGPLPMKYADSSRSKEYPIAKDPTVIRHGNEYLMYYSVMPFDPNPQKDSTPPKFDDWHSGIARSTDLVNWTRVGDLDLRDTQGKKIYGAVAPCVRKLDGQIHIFYQMAWEGTDGISNIWHATSEDGITFTNTCDRPIIVPETNWSIKRSIDAEVYKVKDKLILLFATRDTTATYQIMGMAEAPYGSDYGPDKWTLLTTDGPLMKPEYPWEMSCTEAPTVIEHKGIWYMFYAGAYNHEGQQIGLAGGLAHHADRDGERTKDDIEPAATSQGGWLLTLLQQLRATLLDEAGALHPGVHRLVLLLSVDDLAFERFVRIGC